VKSVVGLADGKLIAGGTLASQNATIARLNENGTFDFNFIRQALQSQESRIFPDRKGGYFVSGSTRVYRIMPEGGDDPNFLALADQPVSDLRLDARGRLLVWGGFTKFAGASLDPSKGVARAGLVRLLGLAAARS
jgi:hypothetical protein